MKRIQELADRAEALGLQYNSDRLALLAQQIRALPSHTRSTTEEIIAALWTVAAVMCFAAGFHVWGWVFAIKAGSDVVCSVYAAIVELRK